MSERPNNRLASRRRLPPRRDATRPPGTPDARPKIEHI